MYTPRLTEPSYSDKYWIQVGSGGYNRCIYIDGNSVLPNCVGYAYGRFMEVMGATSCSLPTSNAEEWYGYTKDGYERGHSPRLGAVVCWRKGQAGVSADGAGHVAIVETINADGSIVTSNSGYRSKRFYTQTLKPPYYSCGSSYTFQGFIYNPCIENTGSILNAFLALGKTQVGSTNDSGLYTGSINKGNPWSGWFIYYCASKIEGILNRIIPAETCASSIARTGVLNGYGDWITEHPEVGDLILIRDRIGAAPYLDKYHSDHVGIVVDVIGDVVYVVEGDVHGTVAYVQYRASSKQINGYYRPHWNAVGDNPTEYYSTTGNLYNTKNTIADAAIREVGYMGMESTTKRTGVRLSVINYTTLLSSAVDGLLVPSQTPGLVSMNVDISRIPNATARAIGEFFLLRGVLASVVIGILANISVWSSFDTSIGLCRWSGNRKSQMVKMSGTGWKDALTSQCEFIWAELHDNQFNIWNALKSITCNTESCARDAANVFSAYSDLPKSNQSDVASKLWSYVIISLHSETTGSIDLMNVGGRATVIPAAVVQTGITGNYTYYDRNWAANTIQKKLHSIWIAKGKTQDRRIATIDGLYLCATTLIFGTTGDRMTVVLEDGTCIDVLLGDSKGTNPSLNGESGTVYGHYLGGKIDVIEWEALVSHPSEIDLTGWKGKKVQKIINRGSYL